MRKNSMRKLAQKLVPSPTHCQECGQTEGLQRHHPDYSKPKEVVILCVPCHVKADMAAGFRHAKQPKQCKVCGADFMPTHSKKHNTCSRECLTVIGRLNAQKRWGGGQSSPTSRE